MAATIFGRFGQIFLLFLTVRIATTILPPDEMAKIFLISSAVNFYASTLISPVGMFINRRLHLWNQAGRVKKYFNYYWIYLLGVGLFGAGVTALLMELKILEFHADLIPLLIIVFGSLVISTLNTLFIPSLNLLGYRSWFNVLTLITTMLSLVVATCVGLFLKATAECWMVGLLAGQLLVTFWGAKVFYEKINVAEQAGIFPNGIKKEHLEVIWRFAWPIFIGAALIWIQTQAYRFLMERSLGLNEVGLFVAGYGISAAIIAGFESFFATYFQPIFYKHISCGEPVEQAGAWVNYASAILPSLILVGFLIVAVAPELTELMLGSSYERSSKFVIWGAIAELARVATGTYGMIAYARMKTWLLLLPNTIGAITSTAMMLWLMPQHGAKGVGFALVLAGVAVFVATYMATRMEMITVLPYKILGQCFIFGALFVLGASFVRSIISLNGALAALILLSILGMIYVSLQYWVLRQFLRAR